MITLGSGDLPATHGDWIQPDRLWAFLFYRHSGVLTVNQRSYAYEPGTLASIPPGARAGHSRAGHGSKTLTTYISADLSAEGPHVVAIPVVHKIEQFESRWDRLQQSMDYLPQGVVSAKAAIWDLVWSVARPRQDLRQNEQLYAAEEWILQNLGRQFEVAELCKELSMSATSVQQMFRTDHAMSTMAYVRFQRVQLAKRLLTNSRLPIKQVAAQVGIDDPQQFNKLIRTFTGMSPRRYRELTGV